MPDHSLPSPSPSAQALYDLMVRFMEEQVLPAEPEYLAHRRAAGADGHVVPPVVEALKRHAKSEGLWSLFLPAASGLTQLEYAPIAELSGWSLYIAPEAINGQAPDTGNMELLHLLAASSRSRSGSSPCWTATSARLSR